MVFVWEGIGDVDGKFIDLSFDVIDVLFDIWLIFEVF